MILGKVQLINQLYKIIFILKFKLFNFLFGFHIYLKLHLLNATNSYIEIYFFLKALPQIS